MTTYRIGSRWRSICCETEIIVVHQPTNEVDLECGGYPMIPHGETADRRQPSRVGGNLLGKRYTDRTSGLVVLVTHAGEGQLSVGETVLDQLEAQLLPSSD
jgi:hypothetical protein